MSTTCEVIGWLLADADRAQVMVREENGDISLHTPRSDNAFGQYAIRTGRFHRSDLAWKGIDPLTEGES